MSGPDAAWTERGTGRGALGSTSRPSKDGSVASSRRGENEATARLGGGVDAGEPTPKSDDSGERTSLSRYDLDDTGPALPTLPGENSSPRDALEAPKKGDDTGGGER